MPKEPDIEYKRFILSLVPPAILLFFIWLIFVYQVADGVDLYYFGIFPRRLSGLIGIITCPFIHANFNHLINNTVPFFFLLTAIFYFYQNVAWRVILYSWLVTGILVWLLARPSYHVGVSGQIYCFASFLFFSGIVRKNINLLAISLLVIFVYGSMVWGIFPYRPDMSFESHLMGLLVGAVLAVHYRHEGPQPTVFMKDMEEDEDEDEDEGQETRDKGQGTDQGQETRDKGQETRDKGQGTRDKGQGTDQGQETRDKGQGTDQGQETRDKGQGTRKNEQ